MMGEIENKPKTEFLSRIDRSSPEEIGRAVAKGGRIQRETLDRLIELLPKKTRHVFWIALEVRTPTMLKTIDNEDDALETIRRLEAAPDLPGES